MGCLAKGLLQPTQVLVFSNGQLQMFRKQYRKKIGTFKVILSSSDMKAASLQLCAGLQAFLSRRKPQRKQWS